MGFGDDLKRFAVKVNARTDAAVVAIVLAVDRALVEKSPVGNPELWANPGNAPAGYVGGRFRANWQYGESEMPTGELYTPVVGPFPSAAESVERVAAQVQPDAGGKIHYLVNNLPYAQAIEDGHSAKQSPAGVVGITVLEFQTFVSEAAAKVRTI